MAIAVDFSANVLSTVSFNIDELYLNMVTGAASTAFSAGYDNNPHFSGPAGAAPLFKLLAPSPAGDVVGTPWCARPPSNSAVW